VAEPPLVKLRNHYFGVALDSVSPRSIAMIRSSSIEQVIDHELEAHFTLTLAILNKPQAFSN
jgi:hypothetical protein